MTTTIKQNTITKPKKNRSAVAAITGFDYQFERMLYHLATSPPNTVVGIETDDDISFAHDGIITLEQDKFVDQSARSKKHPFGNSSENLWKTLQIWTDYVAQSPNRNYRFIFATNSKIKKTKNSLIWMISDAKEKESIKNCIIALRKTKSVKNQFLLQIMDHVKKCKDTILEMVIGHATVADCTKTNDAELVKVLEPPDGIDGQEMLHRMKGWLRSIIMNKWGSGTPCIIERQQYVDAKNRYCQTDERYRKLERPWRDIIVSEEDKINCISKIFIDQILAIKITSDEDASDVIECAIEDYIRFSTENSRLLNEGEITDGEWGVFFDSLKNRWRIIRNRNMAIRQNFSQEAIGRQTYFDTLAPDYRGSLAGQQTMEVYLTHGGYHCLANEISVRWHPDYPPVQPPQK